MDEEERFSASSPELDRNNDNDNENDNDEVMEDADADGEADADADVDDDADADADGDADGDVDADGEDDEDNDNDNENDDDDNEDDNNDGDSVEGGNADASKPGAEGLPRQQTPSQSQSHTEAKPSSGDTPRSGGDALKEQDTKVGDTGNVTTGSDTGSGGATGGGATDTDGPDKGTGRQPTPMLAPRRPSVRPEALNARLYDIVPTMAAPQATSVNAMAITPDLRYWFTGGSDGYIRKYDGPGTINGKLALTVAQRHPFVDSVTKAGILMSYWENEEPSSQGGGANQESVLSPVYSLAVQSDALWLLSGLESGVINLQSVRHDEGKKMHHLQQHTNAVSVLSLAQDEKSVLSGSWDKNILDWDLNTGGVKRSFEGSGGQIAAIEQRPASGMPVPAGADEPILSDTISSNNAQPMTNGDSLFDGGSVNGAGPSNTGAGETADGGEEGQASPAHESLFGGSDAGSLFGETAGEQPFGQEEDEYHGGMSMISEHGGGMDHSADMAMAGIELGKDGDKESAPAVPTPAPAGDSMELDSAIPATQEEASQPSSQPPDVKQEVPASSEGPQLSSEPLAAAQEIKQEDTTMNGVHESALDSSLPQSPKISSGSRPETQYDPSQTSPDTFLSAAMDGTIRIWDRRVPNPVARIGNRPGVPPWCMSACWSPDGNMIYAGRRNGTVEEFDVRKAKRGWEPERVFKFPAGSGAVSAVKPMANGRHLVCASHDILRLYDLRDTRTIKHSSVPFLIIPGPPRAGVISSLYIDPTSTYMLSAAGTRGWDGTSTEVLIGYEINVTE